jgi:hypothetical protein
MTIVSIYSVAMSNVAVQVRGAEKPIFVNADKAEENTSSGQLTIYRDGKPVGHFNLQDVAGWWLEE